MSLIVEVGYYSPRRKRNDAVAGAASVAIVLFAYVSAAKPSGVFLDGIAETTD